MCGRCEGSAGFTLIEMLAALAVLALLSGAVLVSLPGRGGRIDAAVFAAQVASLARKARMQAIETGRGSSIVIDLKQRLISISGEGMSMPMPEDVDVVVHTSASERRGGDVAGIRFFPNGSSTGGSIMLRGSGGSHEVKVNWFTGRVSSAPGS